MQIILLGFVLLLVPTVTVSAAGLGITDRTGDGYWSGSTWEVNIFPGEEKSTNITLYNPTKNKLEVSLAVINSSCENLTYKLSDSSFTVASKDEEEVALSVKAPDGIKPGNYSAELEIKYEVVEEEVIPVVNKTNNTTPLVLPPKPVTNKTNNTTPVIPTPNPPSPTPKPVINWWWFPVVLSIAAAGTCAVWLVLERRRRKAE